MNWTERPHEVCKVVQNVFQKADKDMGHNHDTTAQKPAGDAIFEDKIYDREAKMCE